MRFHIIKSIWRTLLWLICAILLFTNAYIIGGSVLGRIQANQDFIPADSETGVRIFVLSNGVHTDIVLPTQTAVRDWRDDFPPHTFQPSPTTNQPEYIGFGWGEKNLYDKVPTWGDLTVPIFLNATVLPSQSSMHVTYWPRPLKTSEFVAEIWITPEQHESLIDEVLSALARDESGSVISQACCWYPAVNDNFYESPPTYHLFRTCNHWTGKALRNAGLPAPLWSPFAKDIIYHLNNIAPR